MRWIVSRKYLNLLGGVVAGAGVVFVARRLYQYGGELKFSELGMTVWGVVIGGAGVYAVACVGLSYAWWQLLRQSGADSNGYWAIRTYATAQLGKYVPGNVMHFVGRQAIGMGAGVSGRALAKSAFYEQTLLILVGCAIGILGLPAFVPGLSTGWAHALSVGAIIGLGWLAWRVLSWAGVRATCAYFAFFLIAALLFGVLLQNGSTGPPQTFSGWIVVVGVYTLSWVLGIVTPGAPAGVGVREAVLLKGLEVSMAASELVVVVVLARAMTVLGDVFYFFGTRGIGFRNPD